MAMVSLFSSLEYAISVARDIWFHKVNVRCWLEAISGHSCFNQYLDTANESIMQGSMYEKKFGYIFMIYAFGKSSKDILAELKMRFTNKHAIELDIASHEEIKFIELPITEILSEKSAQTINKGDVLAEYSGEIVNDSLDVAKTDLEDNLDDISSVGIDISM
ncbi:uric acid degradation bifunctional protein TTL-like [Arachis ipaensis]|uniref:uric acid degradation bifunctional protein TTL-like n=1 Tax=Arachis ipaensis TaxID=130454 RepID=UPI0007AF57F3|nr:uric acid degradation bifunctional protein TTL-like [Arachis ipaensis]XP_025637693.1 uric acid degradation bifunctional protein TTL-like [Arachis hypogaea]